MPSPIFSMSAARCAANSSGGSTEVKTAFCADGRTTTSATHETMRATKMRGCGRRGIGAPVRIWRTEGTFYAGRPAAASIRRQNTGRTRGGEEVREAADPDTGDVQVHTVRRERFRR